MKRSIWKLCGLFAATYFVAHPATAQVVVDGLPNIADARLHGWYDGNQALGRDGIAETPLWPNRQGNPDHAIGNSFAGTIAKVPTENGHQALRFEDAVSWQNADRWGTLEDSFTVFVAATVRDISKAYFFTGNQGGGGSEANANYQADEPDTWTMEGTDGIRITTAPVVVDQLQLHAFTYGADGMGHHHINGTLAGEGEVGLASMSGFVLGGRQNGNERAWVDFAEVLVFNQELNAADRNAIFGYLDTKFFGSAAIPGDFNADGLLTASDIDDLSLAVRNASADLKFDLNGDKAVTDADRTVWVESLKKTYFGDSTLNGVFDTEDFVAVFTVGEYEDGVPANSGWADGDWNGNGDFESGDFVTAFIAGGYEIGPRAAVAAVPEPSGLVLLGLGAMTVLSRRRRA